MWTIKLPWRRNGKPQAARRGAKTQPDWVDATDVPADDPADDDVPRGCAWFDSSHDLHHGLLVTEHGDPQRVVDDVPLGWWVDWIARGDGAPQPPLIVVGSGRAARASA